MHTTGDLGSRRNSSASSGLFSASEFEESVEGITGFSTSATGASLQYLCVCVCVCVSVCDSFRTIVHHVCVQERVYIIQIIQMQNVKIGSNSSSVRGLKGGRTDR
jgi:hypothetical protein